MKILHCVVFLVTLMALAGVNVKQLYCIHADLTYWKVEMLPSEDKCPCEEKDCCCEDGQEDGHKHSRHVFYKIDDYSRVEQAFHFIPLTLFLPEVSQQVYTVVARGHGYPALFRHIIPGIAPSAELLCTFLC